MKSMFLIGTLIPRSASFMVNSKNALAASQRAGKALSSTTSSTEALNIIFGGDYAGQSATFSSIDGKLIPVPEHFVPESMIEWGQVPNCFECIVSEDILQNDDSSSTLERHVVNIMPEVGCGLDNLDTMATKDTIPLSSYEAFTFENDVKVATAFIEDKRRVECVFVKNIGNDVDEKPELVRMRVSINLHENNQLRSSIEIAKERKTSNASSRGSIAKGGGLHASTVTSLVGKENSNKPFCNVEGTQISAMEGTWASSNVEVELDSEFWSSEESTSFSLPGNILVRECKSPQYLEICMLLQADDNDEQLKRIVVKYLLDSTGNKLECFEEVKL